MNDGRRACRGLHTRVRHALWRVFTRTDTKKQKQTKQNKTKNRKSITLLASEVRLPTLVYSPACQTNRSTMISVVIRKFGNQVLCFRTATSVSISVPIWKVFFVLSKQCLYIIKNKSISKRKQKSKQNLKPIPPQQNMLETSNVDLEYGTNVITVITDQGFKPEILSS